MKKSLFIIAALIAGFGFAQEKGKFRGGLDLGYVTASGGGGILVDLEFKYNVTDNSNVGLRLGTAVFGRGVEGDGTELDVNVSGNGSYLATYDYYFNNGSSSFAPFVGAGLGIYSLAAIEFSSSNDDIITTGDFGASTEFGGMLRAGAEIGKFRLGFEYNLLPKTEFVGGGEAKNSYFGFSLGFYLGGGKWGS